MTNRMRWVLLLAVLAAVVVPLVTANALHWHLAQVHMDHTGGLLSEPRMQIQLAVFAISLVPLVGVIFAALRWLRGRRVISSLTKHGVAARQGSITYWSLPVREPLFFTTGLARSRVYASRGARTRLHAEAFEAGLLHEVAHLRHADGFGRLAIQLCRGAYGWLPGVAPALDTLVLASECHADDEAIAAGASRKDLFEAIAAASGGGAGHVALANEGVIFRLERLARARLQPPTVNKRPLLSVAATLFTIPVLGHVALVAFCGVAPW